MSNMEHKQLTNWILAQVRTINPYTNSKEYQKGNIYAYGFLASYLANILKENPQELKRFKHHINHTLNNK